MAESLINTKRRINTIKSTEKITKAMKLVASVKFTRWKRYLEDNKGYFNGMKEALKDSLLACDSNLSENECVKKHDSQSSLYVLISSSLGLCGSYNYSIFKSVDPLLNKDDQILVIGSKAQAYYLNKDYKVIDDQLSLMDDFRYSKVKKLRHKIVQLYRTGEYKEVILVYTHYKNSMTFIPTIEKLLPFDIEKEKEGKKLNGYPSICEPGAEELLDDLIPHYIDSLLYNRLLESELSEIASRRNAMESATDSADKIVSKLMIEYNKARQSAITQEITEVVAGATSGKKDDRR